MGRKKKTRARRILIKKVKKFIAALLHIIGNNHDDSCLLSDPTKVPDEGF